VERINVEEVQDRRERVGLLDDPERDQKVEEEYHRKKQEVADAIRERQIRLGHIAVEEPEEAKEE
jgi:hypothetical protein